MAPIVPFDMGGFLTALLVGVSFGLIAAAFSAATHFISGLFTKYISYAPLRPVLGGVLIVAFTLALGSTRYLGLGIPSIVEALQTGAGPADFALKFAFTVLTLGCGFKGGESHHSSLSEPR